MGLFRFRTNEGFHSIQRWVRIELRILGGEILNSLRVERSIRRELTLIAYDHSNRCGSF